MEPELNEVPFDEEPDHSEHVDEAREYRKFALLASGVVVLTTLLTLGHFTISGWIEYFMGITFLVFATAKFFDIENVAYGLREYDLVAKRFNWYGWIYPFIELFLGISYIFGLWPIGRNFATLVFATIGLIGVKQTLGRGAKIRCACLGSLIKLPLSKLTLYENGVMGAMALIMIIIEIVQK